MGKKSSKRIGETAAHSVDANMRTFRSSAARVPQRIQPACYLHVLASWCVEPPFISPELLELTPLDLVSPDLDHVAEQCLVEVLGTHCFLS